MRVTAVFLALALALSACTLDDDSVNQYDINAIPLSLEWELGEQVARELATQVEPVDDEVVQAYVQELGDELVVHSELAGRPWVFTVIDDPTVNAFAAPGGRVYVHSGLIEAAPDEETLLAVLAHEIAHGEARHGTEAMTRNTGLALLAALVLGNAGGLEAVAADLAASGLFAKFSRDDEREADRLGLRLLAEAGAPPEALARFFDVILAERARRPNLVEQLFATHPLTEDRRDDVLRRSAELTPAAPRTADPERFAEVQARLSGTAPSTRGGEEVPEIVDVAVSEADDGTVRFDVTVSSPYDRPDRYADAWRVLGPDGEEYGIRVLTHDHADEQPFTRSLSGVEIPDGVQVVFVEARDLVGGWTGVRYRVPLPSDAVG